jgi:triacylglycerol lipase
MLLFLPSESAKAALVLVGGQNDNDIVVVTSGTLADSLKDQIDDLDNSPMVPLQKLIKNCQCRHIWRKGLRTV